MGSIVALLGLALAAACDSSTDPGPSAARRIGVGETVDARLGRADTDRWVVELRTPQDFEVALETLSGSFELSVWDTTLSRRVGTLRPPAGDATTGWRGTPLLHADEPRYTVLVVGEGSYRLLVKQPLVGTAPEHLARFVTVGDTVTGEDMYRVGGPDIDDFTFRGRRGEEHVVYLVGRNGIVAGGPRVVVTDGASGDTLVDYGTGTPILPGVLDHQASPRFILKADGEHTLRFTSNPYGNEHYHGAYEFLVQRISRVPERAPASVAVGDHVTTEALDHVGDVDEFEIHGVPGTELHVNFRVASDDIESMMRLEVLDAVPSGTQPLVVDGRGWEAARGRPAELTDRSTGRFVVPAGGRVTARVKASGPGHQGGTPRWKGGYEFQALPVDRRPESASVALQLGDSVLTERLEHAADVDEFRLVVHARAQANIVLSVDSLAAPHRTASDAVRAELVSIATGAVVAETAEGHPATLAASGIIVLDPGEYLLRVRAREERVHGFSGSYRLHTHALRTAPESAPPVIAIGGEVVERLDPQGDVDEFTLSGARGDEVDITLQTGPATGDGTLTLTLIGDGFERNVNEQLVLERGAPGAVVMRRVRLLATGDYTIRVGGLSRGTRAAETGEYRLSVARSVTTPEHRSAAISVGDRVTDEPIDFAGDADDFVLRAAPGTRIVAAITAGGLGVEIIDPATREVLAWQRSHGERLLTMPVEVPDAGVLVVRVAELTGWWGNHFYIHSGGYQLEVLAAP